MSTRTKAAEDVLGAMADQAQALRAQAYALCPDPESPITNGVEQEAYTCVFTAMEQAESSLRFLQGVEAKRSDVRHDPRSLGHYPHIKSAQRMVAA